MVLSQMEVVSTMKINLENIKIVVKTWNEKSMDWDKRTIQGPLASYRPQRGFKVDSIHVYDSLLEVNIFVCRVNQ